MEETTYYVTKDGRYYKTYNSAWNSTKTTYYNEYGEVYEYFERRKRVDRDAERADEHLEAYPDLLESAEIPTSMNLMD